MSLKKYIPCNSEHANEFEYICLKQKKVFCMKCWFKLQHYRFCQSTRCGQYTKIAHTALNRALEYKNSKLLETFSASKDSYEQLRLRFLQLNYQVSQIVKQFVEQKMPLLFWSMSNELIKSLGTLQEVVGMNKFDTICTELIRIIKSGDSSQKTQFLETSIGAYFDINHQIQGDLYVIKNSNFVHRNHKEDGINRIFEGIKNNLKDILGNIKKGVRKTIDDELERATTAIDQAVKYKGVAFHKMPQNECFRKRQEYPYINIVSQEFGKISNEQIDLYNGFNLSLPELQSNPQQLLQLSKCLLKDRFFSIYEQINTVKSSFSYKYAYPISTTLTKDDQYESLIINMEKSIMQQSSQNKNGSFICSLNLVIMGKELIIIKFYNLPKFCYSRKIYNYRKERTHYYDQLIDTFGLKNVQNRININPDFIEFTQNLTDTELVYCHFQTAYETLFLCNNQQLVFEGQKVMANKGAELLAQTIQKWKLTSQVNLKFNRPMKDLLGYFV